MGWCVYILRCGDGSLYTGMTNDFPARLLAHAAGKGARYTRGRGPLVPVYLEPCADRSEALKREHAVKRLARAQKQRICAEIRQPFSSDARSRSSRAGSKRRATLRSWV